MLVNQGPLAGIPCTLLGLVPLFYLHRKRRSAAAMPALLTFAALTGLGLGPTLRHYLSMSIGSATVPNAATLTATVTQALTGYVLRTGIAFSRIEDFLFAVLVVVLRASIAALFVPVLQVSGSAVAALVCSGFILHDASRLLRCEEDHYVMAACGLYLKG